jgi:hypothetical protein
MFELSSFFKPGDASGATFDDSLVGGVGSNQDVAADEVCTGDVCDRERLLAGVAEHIHSHFHLCIVYYCFRHICHCSYGVGREALLKQRDVPDVLHNAGVKTCPLELGCL